MVKCAVKTCSSDSRKSKKCKILLFRIPKIRKNISDSDNKIIQRRQQRYLSNIKREDLSELAINNLRICSLHFVAGKPSHFRDEYNVDWAPTLKLGIDNNESHLSSIKTSQDEISMSFETEQMATLSMPIDRSIQQMATLSMPNDRSIQHDIQSRDDIRMSFKTEQMATLSMPIDGFIPQMAILSMPIDSSIQQTAILSMPIDSSIPQMAILAMPIDSSIQHVIQSQVLALFPVPSEVAAYYSLEEIFIDAKKLTYPWVILQVSNEFFRLGFISDENQGEHLLIIVTVRDTLVAHVIFLGNVVHTQNLKEMRLPIFLHQLTSHNRCLGIIDPDLQDLASLPMNEKDIYFRHLTYGFSEGRLKSNSTVRSVKCTYFTTFNICTWCRKIKVPLLKKAKKEARHVDIITQNTPLKLLSKNSLKKALMITRKRNRKLESEIVEIKKTKTMIEDRTLDDIVEDRTLDDMVEDRTLDDGSEKCNNSSTSVKNKTIEDNEQHRETYTLPSDVNIKLELQDDIKQHSEAETLPSAVNIKLELEDDIQQLPETKTSPTTVNIKLELQEDIKQHFEAKTLPSAVNIKLELEDDIEQQHETRTLPAAVNIKLELQDDIEKHSEAKTSPTAVKI